MNDKLEQVPPIVARLAEEVKMHPISWAVTPESITIVFEEGQKLHFDRPGASVGAQHAAPVSKPPSKSKPRASRSKK